MPLQDDGNTATGGAPDPAPDAPAGQTLLQHLSKTFGGLQTLHKVFTDVRVEFNTAPEPFLSPFNVVLKLKVLEAQTSPLHLEVVYLDSDSKKLILHSLDPLFPQARKYKFDLRIKPPNLSEVNVRAMLTGAIYRIDIYSPSVDASRIIWSVPIHILVTDPAGQLKGFDEGSDIDEIGSTSDDSSSESDSSGSLQSDFIEEEAEGEEGEESGGDEGDGDEKEIEKDASIKENGQEKAAEGVQGDAAPKAGPRADDASEDASEANENDDDSPSSVSEPPAKRQAEPPLVLSDEEAARLLRQASLLSTRIPDGEYYEEEAPAED